MNKHDGKPSLFSAKRVHFFCMNHHTVYVALDSSANNSADRMMYSTMYPVPGIYGTMYICTYTVLYYSIQYTTVYIYM